MKLLAHKLLISTCLCLATTVTFSQFTFQKTFNSNGDEVANWVTNTATGYLVAGYITTANGNRDGFLLNLDFEGNPIWQKRLGGSGVDQFNAAIETTGGYIVVGETESFGAGGGDLWLLKISTAGTVLWSKTIGRGDTKEFGFDVVPVSGDRLLVSGAQAPVGTTGFNSCLYLLDASGQTIWSNTYTSAGIGNLLRSNYVNNGVIYASGGIEAEGGFVRIDLETGQFLLSVLYPGNSTEALYYQQPTADGNILLADHTWSATGGAFIKQWVKKVTQEGQTLWSKVYTRPNDNLRGRIEAAGDDNFLLTPYDGLFSSNGDALLAKIDADGNIMWSRNYGRPGLDWLWKSQLAADGGFISVGAAVNDNGNRDILVVKTNDQGLIDGCCIPNAEITVETYLHSEFVSGLTVFEWQPSVGNNTTPQNTNMLEESFCSNPPVEIFNDIALCPNQPFVFEGVEYFAPDEIIDTLQGLFGCDTIVHYGLLSLSNSSIDETLLLCEGESVVLNNQIYFAPDTVSYFKSGTTGCDTLFTFYLLPNEDEEACLTCKGTFLKLVGDAGSNVLGHGIYHTGDGNLYVTGTVNDSALIVKMTPLGTVLWSRTFDFVPDLDIIAEIIVDSDGMIAGCGQGGTTQPVLSGFVFRYDPVSDQVLWIQKLSENSAFVMGLVEKEPGGNYIVNSNPHAPVNNAQLTEIARADGAFVASPMSKQLNLGGADNFNSVVVENGKLYGVGRFTAGNDFINMRHTLARYDMITGQQDYLWMGHLFLNASARLYGMDLVIDDDKLVSVGFGDETGEDLNNSKVFFYRSLKSDGDVGVPIVIDLLETTSDAVDEVVKVPGGYILLCHSLFNTPADLFFVKIDLLGNIIWSKKIDFGVDELLPVSIVQSQILVQGDFVFCVATTRVLNGEQRMMVVKMTLDGKMDGTCSYLKDTPATAQFPNFATGEGPQIEEILLNETHVPATATAVNREIEGAFFCRQVLENTVQITICAGESITIGGEIFSNSGTITDTLPAVTGCDSIVTYIISVLPQPTRLETLEFCPGESVTIDGVAYDQSGTVIDTVPGASGCDTIVTYTLVRLTNPARSETIEFCPGESVTIDGVAYDQSGTVIDTVPGASGCDTIVTYTLVRLTNPARSETIEFCPGETIVLGGQSYTQAGTVTLTHPAATGCDTIVTYNLVSLLPSPSVVDIDCPAQISVIAQPGEAPLQIQYNMPVATSDCPCPGVALTLTSGLPSGGLFPNGTTQVCYTAKDSCGSSASCCFAVTVREIQPCDVKVNGCMRYELLSITADVAQNKTYRIRVINNCPNELIYTAIQLPDQVVAMEPAHLSVYTADSGREYDVRNPNFSPFYSIRYKSTSDSISNGQSDIFQYTLPAQSAPLYMNITSRLFPQLFYEAHLNTFYCPIGVTPTGNRTEVATDVAQSPDAGVKLYPNPTDGALWIERRGAMEEGNWRVFNSQGQQVLSGVAPADAMAWRIDLPASLSTGLYFFQLGEGGQQSVRFVLQR